MIAKATAAMGLTPTANFQRQCCRRRGVASVGCLARRRSTVPRRARRRRHWQPPAGGAASFKIPPPWQRGGRAAGTTSKGSETDTVAGQKCLGCLRRSRATCSNSRALPSQVLLFLHKARHFNKLGGRHPQLQWLGGALVRCGEGRGPAPFFLGGGQKSLLREYVICAAFQNVLMLRVESLRP